MGTNESPTVVGKRDPHISPTKSGPTTSAQRNAQPNQHDQDAALELRRPGKSACSGKKLSRKPEANDHGQVFHQLWATLAYGGPLCWATWLPGTLISSSLKHGFRTAWSLNLSVPGGWRIEMQTWPRHCEAFLGLSGLYPLLLPKG